MNWQPIETAPRDRAILGFWPTSSGDVNPNCYGITHFADFRWVSEEDDQTPFSDPTYWMELPEPPLLNREEK